eukprot:CAMPEP_0177661032 /NCGR_PEP_ID=MMETSP0447-20121125/18410_1 /TAXON_ID=0 /ORGANISM="Stygamoeba regulata, Strain BSH-02190019" /LENGTH=197 /DNA_ID=CAMNT_0019166243 /DNA_START=47 /DNA_END=638 /DNA_ORIENTATION=+
MFLLHSIVEQVKVHANQFDKLVECVTNEVNLKYSNRILPGVGLCVRLFDVLELGPGELFPDDGSAYYVARVRLIVFCPLVGEIIEGTIERADLKGLRVTVGFFSDILVPGEMMKDCQFSAEYKTWEWVYKDEEMEELLPFVLGSQIRFRVEKVLFETREALQESSAYKPPMRILGSIAEQVSDAEIGGGKRAMGLNA